MVKEKKWKLKLKKQTWKKKKVSGLVVKIDVNILIMQAICIGDIRDATKLKDFLHSNTTADGHQRERSKTK